MVVSCDDRASIRHIITALFVMIVLSIVAWQLEDSISADGPSVLVIEIDGNIEPLTADRIARGIDEARGQGSSLVVIRLDTPGGLLDSTREIVEEILESDIPVAVYVGPAGARAASAGTFVAAAANFAVMAPGTNIGAATPVKADGQDIPDPCRRIRGPRGRSGGVRRHLRRCGGQLRRHGAGHEHRRGHSGQGGWPGHSGDPRPKGQRRYERGVSRRRATATPRRWRRPCCWPRRTLRKRPSI